MLEGLPIMLALCLMLWHAYYAQNYAGIIDAGLLCNREGWYAITSAITHARSDSLKSSRDAVNFVVGINFR